MVGELCAKYKETIFNVLGNIILVKNSRNSLLHSLSRLVPTMDLTNTKVGSNIAIVGKKHVQSFVKSPIGIIGRQLKMTQLEHGAKIQNSMSIAVGINYISKIP